ncbi:hypothetical protein SAMN04487788_1654 [Microbacterium testaceum StLB037]|uniref:Uncharacterized protein n=1 Tax=Microbacterium testaceum (strain StLB037) TaxID=979556 RepID=A0A1H0P0I5_MICTS|nr:hypothetical protein [Microbacterium testaceum]SDO98180.1 hypothetical protein SAMN04487788_1654 [Microbacterium testaceum StLB037]
MSGTTILAARIAEGTWAANLPTVGTGGDACAQLPGISGLVLQYVQPLRDWLDQLVGEPGVVAATASSWEDVSAALARTSDLVELARTSVNELDGRTVRASRERCEDLQRLTLDAVEWTASTAAALRLASRVVEATRSFVCDALVSLVQFSEKLFSWTLNPFDLADRVEQFARAAADLVQSASRLVIELLEAMCALGALMSELGPLVRKGQDEISRVLAEMLPSAGALLMTALGGPTLGVVGSMVGGAGKNYLQPSTDVEELDPSLLSGPRRDAWDRAQNVTEITSLSDLVSVNGTTDLMGGEDATVIDIKKVVGPDGTEKWFVSLPSTQDWQLFSDTGALNDRDSNVALIMHDPDMRTVYERAVLEAMQDAGIPQGSNVVLAGFSQGGITAASLASDSQFPYNTVGIVTNGTPSDSFDIPSHIPVYAFQHMTDVVPMLDGNPYGSTPENVQRVLLEGPASPIAAHDNAAYTSSVKRWEERYAEVFGGPPPNMDVFTGQVVDHIVYRTHE